MKKRNAVAHQIIDEASEWFVAMREPSIPVEMREQFSEWLRSSPINMGAYLDIARLWGDAVHAPEDFALDPGVASGSSPGDNVISLSARAPDGAHPRSWSRPPTERSRFLRLLPIAASVLVILALSAIGFRYLQDPAVLSTDVGEQRSVTLEDGSTIKLNARSRLRVNLTPQARLIELIDGQALFDVAKSPGRPFIVSSGNIAVRAVGTQFDINRRSSGTLVSVVEGKVSVSIPEPAPMVANRPSAGEGLTMRRPTVENQRKSTPIFLSAGQQVLVTRAGNVDVPARPNLAAATSWLQQELIFDGQPLGVVIDEFNRFSKTPMVLADPSLAELRINAVFHTTKPDALVRFVSRFDGVEVERSPREIRITRAK